MLNKKHSSIHLGNSSEKEFHFFRWCEGDQVKTRSMSYWEKQTCLSNLGEEKKDPSLSFFNCKFQIQISKA